MRNVIDFLYLIQTLARYSNKCTKTKKPTCAGVAGAAGSEEGVVVGVAGVLAGAAAGAGVSAGAAAAGAGAGAALGFVTITTMNFFSSMLYFVKGSSSTEIKDKLFCIQEIFNKNI